MNARQKARKAARRAAHANRTDSRRPKGSELLDDIRKRERDARREVRKASA